MNLLEAVVFGIIQGATEFLPVSSSGHLAIAHRLGLGSQLPEHLEMTFDVLLHSASLLAIVIAFHKDLLDALQRGPRFWLILAFGIVPAGLAGLVLRDLVDGASKYFLWIGIAYLFTTAMLFFSQIVSRRHQQRTALNDDPGQLTIKQAGFVGGMQIFCLFAGVSRSGTTVASGLMVGMSPRLAVSFSFLIGTPLLLAATTKDAVRGGYGELAQAIGWSPLLAAWVVCAVVSYLCILALKLMVAKRLLHWFALYCLLLALLCLYWALVG